MRDFIPTPRAILFGTIALIVIALVYNFITWLGGLYPQQRAFIFQGHPQTVVLPLPDIDFTERDLIEIMAEYNIKHEADGSFMHYLAKLFGYDGLDGLTDPGSRTIWINDIVQWPERKETVIHEALHIRFLQLYGLDTRGPYEDLIEAKAQEIYWELYPAPSGPKASTVPQQGLCLTGIVACTNNTAEGEQK